MWLLNRLEVWKKEDYDKIFNEFKTIFCKKHKGNWTDEQIRERLGNKLEIVFDFNRYHKLPDEYLILYVRMWLIYYEAELKWN